MYGLRRWERAYGRQTSERDQDDDAKETRRRRYRHKRPRLKRRRAKQTMQQSNIARRDTNKGREINGRTHVSNKSVSKAHATRDKAVHRDGRKGQRKGEIDLTSAIRSDSFLQDVPTRVLLALRLLVVTSSHQGGRGGGRRPWCCCACCCAFAQERCEARCEDNLFQECIEI